jgi:threonine dehydrogenase-like Zn-dependent dehydrogenase
MQTKTALRLQFHSIVLLCAIAIHAAPTQATPEASPRRVDRQALVTRHNVVLHQFDADNPLTVGNGGFAFTVDATGLQTFPEAFEHTIPLGTLSDWGWHTISNPNGGSIDTFQFKEFAT